MKQRFLILLFTTGLFSLNAQQGQLRMGISSDISKQPILLAGARPVLSYMLTNNLAVGATTSWEKSPINNINTKDLSAFVKLYAAKNCFITGGLATDFDAITTYSAGIGYTAFLGKKFYLEPVIMYENYRLGAERLGVQLGCGIVLN